MGRIDSPLPTHEAFMPSSALNLGPGHGSLDTPAGGHLAVDFTEGPAPSWESAWIDLGGEG